ncbi:hypothetical protein JMJ35_009911 [Cladonia borealis]|uniref:BZIP domain-containing protein n=1 Tax=Cladonia borealis TaxID=184061 RepID=A0AA39QRT4_9LECA|nr:hypothetical protein JMJ35_009911 [Cladonia borealis]
MTTVTTQEYMSPSSYGSANMFAQPTNRSSTKGGEFLKMFSSAGTTSSTVEPQQTEKHASRANLSTLNTDENTFFDFDSPSPFQQTFSTPGASGMSWGNDVNFHPLSPPNSAVFSPKDWPYSNAYQQPNPASILTNIDTANTRAQYGQVTPPDDDNDNESIFDYHLKAQYQQDAQDDTGGKKRKRNTYTTNESQSPKRARKYASRGASNVAEPIKTEDVKRSKFLERNRVAASKCRQKKKEWTQNLENKARELQKNNSSLRLMVDSLRQEVIFLKGEMLKHNSCSCDQIQKFLKQGSDNFSDRGMNDIVFKREDSSDRSMPRSRLGSVSSTHDFAEIDKPSPEAEPSNTSIVNDENALEALLSSSINHDTSEESIAAQVAQ